MNKTLTEKIFEKHLIRGSFLPGNKIVIAVAQTLTQDSTGTMVYLQLEAMKIKQIKTKLSVAYIDHNTLQTCFENADDHEFIKTAAGKYGLVFSKAGNGICHQLHLEQFGVPGEILLGSDSHTPTCGGLGMIAIGAGGLDVAVAMATGEYSLEVPEILGIELSGALKPWVSAKDVILKILQTLTVKGGVGKIIEFFGSGVKNLSVTDRATITNMGAELGATTSIFPSDEVTKDFLTRQGRKNDYSNLEADEDANYSKILSLNLDEVEPMIAMPHSPDNVKTIQEIIDNPLICESLSKSLEIDQVAIGSCTNSSYTDLMKTASILKGKRVNQNLSLVIAPGSSSIVKMLSDNGALGGLISAGARILEAACGPCIGMGQAPKSAAISLRTFNRNFKGRCGTLDAGVFIVSPETAAVSAITGVLTNPIKYSKENNLENFHEPLPEKFEKCKSFFIYPDEYKEPVEIIMGPNIKPFPVGSPIPVTIKGTVLLKTGDNITTDDIMPSGASLLPYRSNIPELSKHCFATIINDFSKRAFNNNGGLVIASENYGQGSSREHAALVPLYLGVKAILAKSFARIHKSNLINSGILPLIFADKKDYEKIDEFDDLEIVDAKLSIDKKAIELQQSSEKGEVILNVHNMSKNTNFLVIFEGSAHDLNLLKAGGYLNYLGTKI